MWPVFAPVQASVFAPVQETVRMAQVHVFTGPERRRRFTRYSPVGSRSPEAALAELSDRQLVELFHQSQPAWTAPESAYGAR